MIDVCSTPYIIVCQSIATLRCNSKLPYIIPASAGVEVDSLTLKWSNHKSVYYSFVPTNSLQFPFLYVPLNTYKIEISFRNKHEY